MRKFIGVFLTIILLVGFSLFFYYDRVQLSASVGNISRNIGITKPCDNPISYSLNDFDTRFGISKSKLLESASKAEKIWEDEAGKNLFEYSDSGKVKLNLIYDYRQAATDKLKSIGIVIDSSKSTYNALKSRYDDLSSSFKISKAELENDIARISRDRAVYERLVDEWNNKGGAPKNEYEKLQEMQSLLNNEIKAVNQKQDTLNDTADTINSIATVINQLINELNLNVEKYNSTTEETGEEFNEGEYVSDASGKHIDIYQFGNNEKLVRVLAHELGHALDLEHVSDPKAIMYKQNQSDSEMPTVADINELDRVCSNKK